MIDKLEARKKFQTDETLEMHMKMNLQTRGK